MMLLLEQHSSENGVMFGVLCCFHPTLCSISMLIVRYVTLVEGEDKPCWLFFLFPCLEVGVLCTAVNGSTDICSSA